MEHDPNQNSTKRRRTDPSSAFASVEKRCHQCDQSDKKFMVKCHKCTTTFCVPCITKWYPNASEEEFVKACPSTQGYSCSKLDEVQYSKYILRKVFPLARRLNEEQLVEKELEAKNRGLSLSKLHLMVAKLKVGEKIDCDHCGADIFDLYRSCDLECGYDLCLVCCRDLLNGNLLWKSGIDGIMPCPPNDIGGCDDGILELKRIMPVDFVVKLLEKAHGLYEIIKSDDVPETNTECCTCYNSCNKTKQEKRSSSYLYFPSAKDIQPQDMKHFQLHWSKGEPVIVSVILSTSTGLRWEPMVLWRAFRDITKSGKLSSRPYEVNAIDCSDWSKVKIGFTNFCKGYSDGLLKRKGRPLVLTVEDWKPFCDSKEERPPHFVEFFSSLPFKEYTHPQNGYLNVAFKLPDLCSKPDMGPRMDIAYADSVTKLHYDKSDTVNVLVNVQTHKKSIFHASTKLNQNNMVKREHGNLDEDIVCAEGIQINKSQRHAGDLIDAGAAWDIFQRQDIPKLEKYLLNHSAELKLAEQVDKEHPELEEIANDNNLEEEIETVTKIIDCPDPEFSDFEKNRKEGSFNAEHIWACYDTREVMPRCYAYIKKVESPGFKLLVQWLKPILGSPDEKKWREADLPVSCGNFKRGRVNKAEDIQLFSHLVSFQAGHKAGTYRLIPRKGDTWALFKNWSINWHFDKERKYEYEFVEVLSDYHELEGVRVSYLEKVKGFVCLFKRKEDGERVIAGSDKYRFAHMIPSCRMSGEEKKGVPKGSFELDPAGLPLSTFEQVFHPIHDRTFYMNTEHKKKLKEEFGIEPWTFKQNLGDAVFIPAGCPYQLRNLKSNMKVRLEFLSPENVDECIHLQHEIRMLPDNHRAKQEKLNIEKMMIYALDHALVDLESNGRNNDLDFAKMPDILQGDTSNICNHTNGWLDDIESIDNSHKTNNDSDRLDQQEFRTIFSLDRTVNNEPAALQDSDETVGLWRGNHVGLAAKELLEAVEKRYPKTFQRVQTRFKEIWLLTMKEFHKIIKGFLETSVDEITEEQITNLREDLKVFERSGFDLSWAQKRLDMVEKLKFGNEPLRHELMALEEPLKLLKDRLDEKQKQFVEAQLEYENAKDARNNKAKEVAKKFGDDYDRVLKGKLGFGILPGY